MQLLRLRSAIRRHHSPRGRFWAKCAALGNVKWRCFRSCWTVLSHVMRGWPSCLLQSAGGEANRILLASALSSMHIICPNRVNRCDWIIAVSLGCFVNTVCEVKTVDALKHYLTQRQWKQHTHIFNACIKHHIIDVVKEFLPVWLYYLSVLVVLTAASRYVLLENGNRDGLGSTPSLAGLLVSGLLAEYALRLISQTGHEVRRSPL